MTKPARITAAEQRRPRIGRPRLNEDAKRVPVSFRTTPNMSEKITAAAKASGRSLAQEVEYRLERSFRDDDVAEAIWSRLAEKS
jgi:hypothetical protein